MIVISDPCKTILDTWGILGETGYLGARRLTSHNWPWLILDAPQALLTMHAYPEPISVAWMKVSW